MNLKIIKIISVISFLMICSLGKDDLPIFVYILFSLYQFINDIVSLSFSQHDIFWEGIIAIPIIGTLYIFLSYRYYKDRYLMALCFIALLSIVISLMIPSTYYSDIMSKLRLSFIIPFIIFVVSSIYTVIHIFRNKIK